MKKRMKHAGWPAAILFLLCLLAGCTIPVKTHASKMDLVYLPFQVDDGEILQIAAYESNFENNVFLSLRELSQALSGTVSQFSFYNDADGYYQIETGKPYDPELEPKEKTEPEEGTEELQAGEPREADEEAQPRDLTPEPSTWLEFVNNWMFVDGKSVNYFSYADYGIEDLFVSLLDAGMFLDLHIVLLDGVYHINTNEHFQADLNDLLQKGYFDYLHGMALGDATTGELFLSCHGKEDIPIASTTKLMTYLVAKRLMEIGRISENDIVTISENAARISRSDNSLILLAEGQQTTVRELIEAMLVGSSNECALALAEYCAGSEAEFVRLMNAMAAKLGLASAVFYNPHGLPSYFAGGIVTMVENRMSAEDLFRLTRTVLLKYPEIEEITSSKAVWLDSLGTEVRNTNLLLDNMPEVFGLKTGTTDAAGTCLISARRTTLNGQEHIIVAVVMGAEFGCDRIQVSELLQRGSDRYLMPEPESPSLP